MANNRINRFSKFNTKQQFTLFNKDQFVEGDNWDCEDLFSYDMVEFGEVQSHLLVGFWKFTFPDETRIPGAASYKYNIGVKTVNADGTVQAFHYVSCPAHMNKVFDSIKNDKSLIDEINRGNCFVCPYTYEKRGKECYSVEFC